MRPTLFLVIGGALGGMSACANTPIDAVVLVAAGEAGAAAQVAPGIGQAGAGPTEASGGSGGESSAFPPTGAIALPDAGPLATCEPQTGTLADGIYRLVLVPRGECLTSGAATTVNELPAFETLVTTSCGADAAFRLEKDATSEAYEVRNVSTDFNLDVRQLSSQSGTPLVLFGPHRLDNQRYFFRARTDSDFEISPANATDKCVTRRTTDIEIWPCSEIDPDQSWSVLDASCDPP